jgi:CRP-like cAMP-binding protein
MATLEFLRTVGLFNGLNDSEIGQLEPFFSEKEYFIGERIFQGGQSIGTGEMATHLYVLEEGEVAIRFDLPMRESDEESTIATVEPGKCFGWSALVPPHRYTLSAYCASERAKAIAMKRDELVEVFEKNPRIGYVVMANLTRVIAKRCFSFQDEYARQKGQSMMRW